MITDKAGPSLLETNTVSDNAGSSPVWADAVWGKAALGATTIDDSAGLRPIETDPTLDKAFSAVVGTDTIADKAFSAVVGTDTIADKAFSAVVGTDTIADKAFSAVVGTDTIASTAGSSRADADTIADKAGSARAGTDTIADRAGSPQVGTDALLDKAASSKAETEAISDKPDSHRVESDTMSDKWHREVELASSFGKGFSTCVTDLIDQPLHFAKEAGYSLAAGAVVTALSNSSYRPARIAGGIAKGVGIAGIGVLAFESALPFAYALDGNIGRSPENMDQLNGMANSVGKLAGHLPTTVFFGGMGMKAMSLANPAKYGFALDHPLKSMPEMLVTGQVLQVPQYAYSLQKSMMFW